MVNKFSSDLKLNKIFWKRDLWYIYIHIYIITVKWKGYLTKNGFIARNFLRKDKLRKTFFVLNSVIKKRELAQHRGYNLINERPRTYNRCRFTQQKETRTIWEEYSHVERQMKSSATLYKKWLPYRHGFSLLIFAICGDMWHLS